MFLLSCCVSQNSFPNGTCTYIFHKCVGKSARNPEIVFGVLVNPIAYGGGDFYPTPP